jgi:hypothetical protein
VCLTRSQVAQKGIVTELKVSDVVAAQETGFVKHYCATARHLSPNVVEHVFYNSCRCRRRCGKA